MTSANSFSLFDRAVAGFDYRPVEVSRSIDPWRFREICEEATRLHQTLVQHLRCGLHSAGLTIALDTTDRSPKGGGEIEVDMLKPKPKDLEVLFHPVCLDSEMLRLYERRADTDLCACSELSNLCFACIRRMLLPLFARIDRHVSGSSGHMAIRCRTINATT